MNQKPSNYNYYVYSLDDLINKYWAIEKKSFSFIDWSVEVTLGKAPDEPLREFVMPNVKKKFPPLPDADPIDWENVSQAVVPLPNGKQIPVDWKNAIQELENLAECDSELSDTELEEARCLEEVIEYCLETKYDPKNPEEPIDIDVYEMPDDRILDWLADRYPSWKILIVDKRMTFCSNG